MFAKKIGILLFLYPFLVIAQGEKFFESSIRYPNETFAEALARTQKHLPQSLLRYNGPYAQRKPIHELSFSNVPKVSSYQKMVHAFNFIRDERFLKPPYHHFKRRISWLYPDDGCFVRAELSRYKLKQKYHLKFAKIFAFGDLKITTPYTFKGSVYWWYHVALIISHENNYYVFDPAIDPSAPMPVDNWLATMSPSSKEIFAAICEEEAYTPISGKCSGVFESVPFHTPYKEQLSFLKKEWNRIYYLGYNPYEILGDLPPWKPN